MRTIERNIVSALLETSDGRLFQAKKNKKDGGVYQDCWHIPGGGIEDGEDSLTAIQREIKEEVGLEIPRERFILIDDLGKGESEKKLKETGEIVLCKMNFLVFKVDLGVNSDQIQINLCDEFSQYQWTKLEDLGNVQLTPPSVELFKRLGYIH